MHDAKIYSKVNKETKDIESCILIQAEDNKDFLAVECGRYFVIYLQIA